MKLSRRELTIPAAMGVGAAAVGAAVISQGSLGDIGPLSGTAALQRSSADPSFYITIKGNTQGEIKGDVTNRGREGSIIGLGLHWEGMLTQNAPSGLGAAKLQHKPIRILTDWGKAVPPLFKAWATNENLTSVELKLLRVSGTGTEDQFFTIKLTNARISGIALTRGPDPAAEGSAAPNGPVEIALSYEKMQLTSVDGGTSAEESWQAGA